MRRSFEASIMSVGLVSVSTLFRFDTNVGSLHWVIYLILVLCNEVYWTGLISTPGPHCKNDQFLNQYRI